MTMLGCPDRPDEVLTLQMIPNIDQKQLLFPLLVSKKSRASRRVDHDRCRHWSHPDRVPRHPV